jgi:DUF4097 and DUF4098 domain-containing protein YvlB
MMITGGRAASLLVGIPLVVGVAGFGAFNMVGNFAQSSEHHEASLAYGGGEISVQLNSGSVRISAGTADTVAVSYTSHYQLKKPAIAAGTANGGVQLTAKCPGGLWSNNCAVNYTLTVPTSARLTVHTGNGSISLVGVTGNASLDTGNGRITVDGGGGAIVARTGNGSILGTNLESTSVHAKTGNGRLDITWSKAPANVDARTGNGSIALTVPASSGPYDVVATTGNGRKNIQVPVATGASSSIAAHTGNGSINIRQPAADRSAG